MIVCRTELKIGVSGAKFDVESDFEVHLAVASQKPCQNSKKLILLTRKIRKHFRSKPQFFAIFLRFLRSYGQTDLKIRFGIKIRSRYTYPEVCTTKNHEIEMKFMVLC